MEMQATRWGVAALSLLLSQSAPAPQLPPPRDPVSGAKAGHGAIAGRVADRDDGRPVRWATVSASRPGQTYETSADAEGRYRIDGLPPGPYLLSVRKAGYVAMAYGRRIAGESATPIHVAGDRSETADFLLNRGGAVEGRITNQAGEPVLDAAVSALRVAYDSYGRRMAPTSGVSRTDDRGWFRLHSLPAGAYFIQASRASLPPNTAGDAQEAAQRPAPFAATFHPGTTRPDRAIAVRVEKAETQRVEIVLAAEPLHQLSGTVLDSRGEPPAATGASVRYANGAPFGGFASAAGRNVFAFTNLHPGEYVLVVTAASPGRDVEFAVRSFVMHGGDLNEGTITTAPGLTLEGTVVATPAEGAVASPLPAVRVAAVSTLFPGLVVDPNQRYRPVAVGADNRFKFTSVYGPRLFRVDVPEPWALEAVFLGDRDVTDVAVNFRGDADAAALRVAITARTGSVSGTVPVAPADIAAAKVVVFGVDDRQWAYQSRYTRVSPVYADGGFEIRGLLPGQYLVAATVDLEPGAEGDAEVLARLRPSATPVEVAAGSATRVKLERVIQP